MSTESFSLRRVISQRTLLFLVIGDVLGAGIYALVVAAGVLL